MLFCLSLCPLSVLASTGSTVTTNQSVDLSAETVVVTETVSEQTAQQAGAITVNFLYGDQQVRDSVTLGEEKMVGKQKISLN
ncbi:hypothetical protein [Lactiplantibacillus carotarum]|uniref:hypothetical protein n=1 Tax=Lactiplantibacillus carotarum TaxID=2993456 RepID=UPI00298EE7CA|nr:hypothetical protein [Lactiplantibacillus carotarum]